MINSVTDCVFCKIVEEELPAYKVYENDQYVAFLDQHPIADGHTLVVPKNHTDYVFDLGKDEYQGLFELARPIAAAIQAVTGSVKVGMAVEGLGVRHVHVHLIPVNEMNGLDPHRAHVVPPEALADMQKKITKALA